MEDIKKILNENGWEIESESPFEIRHVNTNSFASGNEAVYSIYYEILYMNAIEKLMMINEAHNFKFVNDAGFIDAIKEALIEIHL